MRSFFFFSLFFILAGSAYGADHFTCKVQENRQTVTVVFAVDSLATPSRTSLVALGGEDEGPVLVKPKRLKN